MTLSQDLECHITGVYIPNCRKERVHVYKEIGVIRGLKNGPRAVFGDLSFTRFLLEKRICSRKSSTMEEFSDFIEDVDLVDPQLEKRFFTWFKGDSHIAASRIDRILTSEE